MEMSHFARTIMERKYAHIKADGSKETWFDIAHRVTKNVMRAVGVDMRTILAKRIRQAIIEKKFVPAGRYLYAAGNPVHQVCNCFALQAYDSREGWSELLHNASMALMTGGGIGVVYSNIRHEGALIRKTGGVASGPIPLIQIVNEVGRGIIQGGDRRSAIWAGLSWQHPDVLKFIRAKDWPEEIRQLKAKDFSFPAPLDQTNISVLLDEEFFSAYLDSKHQLHSLAYNVYWTVIERALKTGEPGFSVDLGDNALEILRNACCEFSSVDQDNACNLGSLNLARIESIEEMHELIELATAFMLAGSVYTTVPYKEVDRVITKHRELGLGLMGVHEWLLTRGKPYGPDPVLGEWLAEYARADAPARKWAKEWGLKRPRKTRAIAPNGTTAIVAETTGGIEPIFCVAYKRRYLKGSVHCAQYVIDPVARRLIDSGVDPDSIEDAYALAQNPERRIAFQAWVQQYVDHAISSTVNLPPWGSELNNASLVRPFGEMLLRYLPRLRGITMYPDGGRSGQPLVPVPYEEAAGRVGCEIVEEQMDVCSLKGGSCGD